MATIVTREFGTTAKGSPLTNQELDDNFTNLNTELGQKAVYKQPVLVATTTNITLSGLQSIDGITVVAGDRVLVKDQTVVTNNGIYVAASETWARSTDADSNLDLVGAVVTVLDGSASAGETFKCNFVPASTIGTTGVFWHRILLVEYEGTTLGRGNTTNAQLLFPTSTLTTTPVTGAVEYDGFHHTVVGNNGLGRAPITGPIFTSGLGTAGAVGNTLYPMFPAPGDTITLPIGTYFYEVSFRATVATSVTASTMNINLRGAGTAVGTQTYNGTSLIAVAGTALFMAQVPSTALTTTMVVTNTSSVAGRSYMIRGSGILRITTAGTIIPSYLFPGALSSDGGTTTLFADNYLLLQPLATSSTAASTGAWA